VASISLRASGHTTRGGLALATYTAALPGRGGADQPAALSYARLAELEGGRLPIGIKPPSAAMSDTAPVTYRSTTTVTAWVEPRTRRVVDLRWTERVRASVTGTIAGTVPLDEPVQRATRGLPAATVASATAAARHDVDQLDRREDLHDGAWATGGVAVLAAAAAAALALRPRPRTRPEPVASSSTAGALPG
jgi:high-affinity iron transporter